MNLCHMKIDPKSIELEGENDMHKLEEMKDEGCQKPAF